MNKFLCLSIFLMIPVSVFSQVKFDTVNVKQIGEGAFHYSIIAQSVPWTLEVVEFDLTNGIYSLETVKAQDRLAAYEKTSSMSARKSVPGHEVIAAVNGDFYSGGTPTNLQVLNGEILTKPINREVFGYSDNSEMFINTTSYDGVLKIGETTTSISNVNRVRNSNEIIFYNHFFGSGTSTNNFGTELTLKAIDPWIVNGEVRAVVVSKIVNEGNSSLSDSTFVLSGHGAGATTLNSVSSGDTLTINHKVAPATEALKQAVGGSAKFLNDGQNQGNWPERHPRSALGFNADTTKFYFVTVDGRQSTSAGMTLTELGDFMLGIGAHNALNLDGGGSTTLVVHNEVANSPSDGSGERSVANALMLVSNKEKTGNVQRLNIDPSIKKIYRDQRFTYKVEGTDENYFPVNLNTQDLTFSLSEGFDAEITNTGLFTAGNNPDTGYVFVEYNGYKDSSLVEIKGIMSFNLFPEEAVTDDNLDLVFFNKSYDSDGISQSVSNANVNWEVEDENIGTIENGVFKGVTEGVTNVIGTFDGVSDTSQVKVQIGSGITQIEDFESIEGFTLDGENIDLANSSVSTSESIFTEGEKALKIDYQFTYAGTPSTWAYVKTNIPVFGVPDTILIDGRTDGKEHLIDAILTDDNGEEFTIRLKRYADNTDFEEYYLSMENVQAEDPSSSYYYPITITGIGIKLKSEQVTGETYSGSIFFDNMRLSYPKKLGVSVEENPEIPSESKLDQNYPNPFNPTTVISFRLAKSGLTTLKVYDMLGREVSTLLNENMTSGTHNIPFDGSNLASGIYIYQLSSKGVTITRRMTLIK
ncbi:MAG: phosphodiester glycosidase family protein [Balneola sp.]|nr:phosphodiester glycosidase family protein [Balneola sp.]MBO6710754.1 phosphodiester glycosidase family protein [Balneola sp.]MBO6799441.1 phosphodiester glycosidase family protein [Balneola sp.]MBO6869431.1 phosphodiester glycosidase family protein [Balneola sp.]